LNTFIEPVLELYLEAQWEYSCRAGTTKAYNNNTDCLTSGNEEDTNLDPLAWYLFNAKDQSKQHQNSGTKKVNDWNLYDMHGNVWEWCLDWSQDYNGDVINPIGATSGTKRVFRSGSWDQAPRYCRSAYRNWQIPTHVDSDIGFRIALTPCFFNETKIVAPDGETVDGYGTAVAVNENWFVVGSANGTSLGAAYIYKKVSSGWQSFTKIIPSDGNVGAHFGNSVAIQNDVLVVGSYIDDDNGSHSGSAYVFRYDGTTWTQEAKLTASDAESTEHFGAHVSIWENRILIGAPGYIHGARTNGKAYVFKYDGTSWIEEAKLTASDGADDDRFGQGCSIYQDRIAVGAYFDDDKGSNSGSVYIFKHNGTNWIQETKLTASDGQAGDALGHSVDIWDGRVVAGAPIDNVVKPGFACVFKFNGTDWEQETILKAFDSSTSDCFGGADSVAIYKNFIVIGASRYNSRTGSINVFKLQGNIWQPAFDFIPKKINTGALLGTSVSLYDNIVAVGAPNDKEEGDNTGSAYIFEINEAPSKTAQLTMTAAPDNSGTTVPSIGNHTVNKDESIAISAQTKSNRAGGQFVKWTATENATIADTSSANTTVVLVGDATVTANYITMAELTMSVTPAGGGTTDPVVGTSTIIQGIAQNIKATMNDGFMFNGWTATENATITDASSADTTVILVGDATITANFVAIAKLTMAVNPVGGGTTDPVTGTSTIFQGIAQTIKATLNDGFVFNGWTASENATITDASSAETTIVLVGDATVTANFVAIAKLTMAVNPVGGGTTDPVTGTSTIVQGVAQNITANSAEGYNFVSWEGSENADIADQSSRITTVTLRGDASINAIFTPATTGIILLISPNGGENWKAGTTQTIKWASAGVTGSVMLELYQETKSTVLDSIIVKSTENSGSYVWTLPTTQKEGNYKVKISSITSPDVSDVSDGSFTVEAAEYEVDLTMLVSPENSGTTDPAVGTHKVVSGTTKTITATPIKGYKFVGWKNAGYVSIEDSSSASTTVTFNGNCIITAVFILDNNPSGTLLLISPNGGENWETGSTQKISWVSYDVDENITLELYRDGAFDSTIVGNITNTGSYNWNIPATQSPGNTYRIRISASSSPSINDASDANFSVNSANIAELTVKVFPEASGSTTPVPGTYNLETGKEITISATPVQGNKFIKWKASQYAVIADPLSATTTVKVTDKADITALFSGTGDDYEMILDFGKILLILDTTKDNSDRITILKAELSDLITDESVTPDDFSFTLTIDDYTITIDNDTGILKQKGKNAAYSYKANKDSAKVRMQISMIEGKRFWSFGVSKVALASKVDSTDGVDIFLTVGNNMIGDYNVDMDQTTSWKFTKDDSGDNIEKLDVDGKPMSEYDILKAGGKCMNYKENRDSFGVTKGVLDIGNDYVFAEDEATVSIDDWEEIFDTGVEKNGKITFKGTTFDNAKYLLLLNLKKKDWKLKLSKVADLSTYITAKDGIDITLEIGGYASGLRVNAESKTTLKYPTKD